MFRCKLCSKELLFCRKKLSDHCRKRHKKRWSLEQYESSFLTGSMLDQAQLQQIQPTGPQNHSNDAVPVVQTAKCSLTSTLSDQIQKNMSTQISQESIKKPKRPSCVLSKKVCKQSAANASRSPKKMGTVGKQSGKKNSNSPNKPNSENLCSQSKQTDFKNYGCPSNKTDSPNYTSRSIKKDSETSKEEECSDVENVGEVEEVDTVVEKAAATSGGWTSLESLCRCRCKICHEQMYHHELKSHWKRSVNVHGSQCCGAGLILIGSGSGF